MILVSAVVAGLLVLAVVAAVYLLNRPQPKTAPPAETAAPAATATPTPSETPEPPAVDLNILLLGSDSRGNAREQEAQAVAGTPADQRSDAIMLVHVPADRKRIYGISIMRDLWVDIPGYGPSKINAGLGLGGIPLTVQTVESLLGAHIDHTVMMDFEGFSGLTDALGGVDVDVKLPFTSTLPGGHTFPAGVNRLDGAAALDFVRERYAFPDGDYQRVRDQQAFLRAVLVKALAAGMLSSPGTVRNLAASLLPFMSVDQGFSADALGHLGSSLRGLHPEDAVFFTLPTAGTGTSPDGQSIVLPDNAAIASIAAALAGGTLADYVAANGLESGN
ncbi:LytR family transcriptional regulator [Arthrobacter sp. PAMC25564]|nr:LytR family transcriptional regulator [Arthrobacter sp. PAMC25564]